MPAKPAATAFEPTLRAPRPKYVCCNKKYVTPINIKNTTNDTGMTPVILCVVIMR